MDDFVSKKKRKLCYWIDWERRSASLEVNHILNGLVPIGKLMVVKGTLEDY